MKVTRGDPSHHRQGVFDQVTGPVCDQQPARRAAPSHERERVPVRVNCPDSGVTRLAP